MPISRHNKKIWKKIDLSVYRSPAGLTMSGPYSHSCSQLPHLAYQQHKLRNNNRRFSLSVYIYYTVLLKQGKWYLRAP